MSNLGRPVVNRYKVPGKQWRKWSNAAKGMFNTLYAAMRPSRQWVFMHPKSTIMQKELWETTRWNVAWSAADAVDGQPPITHIVQGGRTIKL
jgi:hypothetical protein